MEEPLPVLRNQREVSQVDTVPAFASVSEAMDMMLAGLSYLAAADPAALPAETQAEYLRGLERTDAISTAVRAWFLSAFTAGQGYTQDADYSVRACWCTRPGSPAARPPATPPGPGGPPPIPGSSRR